MELFSRFYSIKGICIITLFTMGLLPINAGTPDGLELLQNLKGYWSFSIGIDNEWISPEYNDSKWETIKVPSAWEDQGFNGYNGYAFYRKKLNIPAAYQGRMLYLYLGYIDDVDAVYINGHHLGSKGEFPPNFHTAYNAERVYQIPENFIRFNEQNVIVVKVYDVQQEGGIVKGEIGLYGGKPSVRVDFSFQNQWKFKTGDDMKWKEPDYDDSKWNNIYVPSFWENAGYRNYDGFAWYRKTFVYTGTPEERMVLILGKIDDADQVYINGKLVGSTGNLTSQTNMRVATGEEYKSFRGYYLPPGLLKKGQKYVIAIRVLDTGGEGGIYEGPIGIVSQTKYIDFWRRNKR
jgi:hypothetical protein